MVGVDLVGVDSLEGAASGDEGSLDTAPAADSMVVLDFTEVEGSTVEAGSTAVAGTVVDTAKRG